MGREIRKVTPNYEHPKDDSGQYKPLFSDFEESLAEFEDYMKKNGLRDAIGYFGGSPSPEDYMLVEYNKDDGLYYGAKDEERTWLQVFETVSEGSPVSPPFETVENLIEYLVEKGDFWCQSRGNNPPPRESVEAFVNSGWAPSAIMANGVIKLGIDCAG